MGGAGQSTNGDGVLVIKFNDRVTENTTKKHASGRSKEGKKATAAKSVLGPMKRRKSLDDSPTAWLAATSNLNLRHIIKPIMTWKDVYILLLKKGWSYTKGNALSALFYVYSKSKIMSKTELLRDGVRGRDY